MRAGTTGEAPPALALGQFHALHGAISLGLDTISMVSLGTDTNKWGICAGWWPSASASGTGLAAGSGNSPESEPPARIGPQFPREHQAGPPGAIPLGLEAPAVRLDAIRDWGLRGE